VQMSNRSAPLSYRGTGSRPTFDLRQGKRELDLNGGRPRWRPPVNGSTDVGYVSPALERRSSHFFTPESRRFLLYSSRSAALTWLNMSGAAATVVVAAAAVAFGFVAFLAKAPEVETARIAKTRTTFFMLGSLEWKNGRHGFPNWRRLVGFQTSMGIRAVRCELSRFRYALVTP
jgi:hypothetical protein